VIVNYAKRSKGVGAETAIRRDDNDWGCTVITWRRYPLIPWRWHTMIGNHVSAREFVFQNVSFKCYADLFYRSGLGAKSAFAIHDSILSQLNELGESGMELSPAIAAIVHNLETRNMLQRKIVETRFIF
jgi:hypothetical protein